MTYENYAKLRNKQGLKDSDVAKKACIPPSTFTDWKKGKSVPKEEKMKKIANALNVSYATFIGIDEDEVLKQLRDAYVRNAEEQEKKDQIFAYLNQLNEEGFKEVIKRLEELSELSKYRKEDS